MELKFDHQKFKVLIRNSTIPQMLLAELAGTSDRYIRAMSSGKKVNPSAAVLCSICQVIGHTAEDCMSPYSYTEYEDG